ncbi:MAG TPA: hypothetical protein VJ851_00825 [Jatrophihabitans sp.]|nr:hypothetical protein [Jatrophihabitans sp.]
MTVTEPVDVLPAEVRPNPDETARRLLALTMLASVVKGKADELRDEIRQGWAVGEKIIATLPNPDDPQQPFKVGEVRCDSGAVVPAVSDPAAFEAWARSNARDHVVVEPARWPIPAKPSPDLQITLSKLFDTLQRRCVGPFAESPADVIYEALCSAGWLLTKVEMIPERTVVLPGYVQAVLDMSKAAKMPCAPGGLIPDGVTVRLEDPKPHVSPTRDAALVQAFVESLRDLPLPAAAELALDGLT